MDLDFTSVSSLSATDATEAPAGMVKVVSLSTVAEPRNVHASTSPASASPMTASSTRGRRIAVSRPSA